MPSLARKRVEDEHEIVDAQPLTDVQEVQPGPDAGQLSDMQATSEEQPEPADEPEAVSEERDAEEADEEELKSKSSDSDEVDPDDEDEDDEEDDGDEEDEDERDGDGDDADDDDDDDDEDEDEDEEDRDDDDLDAASQSSELQSSEQSEPETLQAADAQQQSDDDAEAVSDAHQLPQGRPDEMRILEALLFASKEPIDEKTLTQRLPAGVELQPVLALLKEEYAHRGVNLVRVNGKWTFRTASDLAWLMTREAVQPRKLSRAAVETLAVIAYHQPVTRAEIEDIRGVSISKGTLDVLLETGWIKPRGRRKVPGRPLTYGTTEAFISHFGLEQLGDLPGLDELKGSGMLEGHLPPNFSVPVPSDDPTLREDEDPLEPGDLDFGLAPRVETTEE